MKNFLILLVVVLAGAAVYWKFRGDIHQTVEELKDAEGKGGGAAIIDAAKNVIPSATDTEKVDDKLPLVDSDFIRRLPDSLTEYLASGRKADVVVEVCDSEDGGMLPTQMTLNPNAWLDTSSIQAPAGGKVGSLMLVHLLAASPSGADATGQQYAIQCAAEPASAGLEGGVRKAHWRAPLLQPASVAQAVDQGALMWVTEFATQVKRGELPVSVNVEGTFGALQRASGNRNLESIMLEEAKEVRFFINKGTIAHNNVQEAEKFKKQGHRVTLKLLVRTNDNPKYVAQEVSWGAPVQDKFQHWRSHFVNRKLLRNAIALGRWAEIRGLETEAQEAYQLSQELVTRDGVSSMGRPRLSARLHLADEVQDHRVYTSTFPAHQTSGMQWRQLPVEDEFYAPMRPAYVVLRTNARNESAGSCVLTD